MPHSKQARLAVLAELGINADGQYDDAAAEMHQRSATESTRMAANLRRMLQHPQYFDRLTRLNRAFVRQRQRQQIAPTVAPRSACVARPRERRDGSQRHSTRGGPDDDPGSDPEPLPERLCACGCGSSVAHKRADALTFGPACRQRLKRAGAVEDGLRALDDDAQRLSLAVDGEVVARLTHKQADRLLAAGMRMRQCERHAIVYRDSAGCPRCADLCTALLAGNGVRLPRRERVRLWRGELGEQPRESRVATTYASYAAVWDELPPPYSFEAHQAQHAHLEPSDRLTAFLALPAWQQTEAYATLRARIVREREAVAR